MTVFDTELIKKFVFTINQADIDWKYLKEIMPKINKKIQITVGDCDDFIGKIFIYSPKDDMTLTCIQEVGNCHLLFYFLENHYSAINCFFDRIVIDDRMAHKMLIYSTTDLQTITDSMGNNIKFIADLSRHNGEVADVHFLLINPRKEVVKWALDNKILLRIVERIKVNSWDKFESFIRTRQAIPELQELVLNSLKRP